MNNRLYGNLIFELSHPGRKGYSLPSNEFESHPLPSSLLRQTDASLPDETEKEILDIIGSFPDVSEPHNLRTRRIGSRIAIEAHIRMDGALTLLQAHDRTTEIENKLKDRFGRDTLVTLHTEPVKPSDSAKHTEP